MKNDREKWQEENAKLKEEVGLLKERQEITKKQVKDMEVEVEALKKADRKNNIVISGVKWGSNFKANVTELCKSNLSVDVEVEDAFRVAVGRNGEEVVVAKLKTWEEKREIMKRKSRLGSSRVYINDDLTQKEQAVQKKLREMAREEKSKGKNVKVGYQKITVDGVTKNWREMVEPR